MAYYFYRSATSKQAALANASVKLTKEALATTERAFVCLDKFEVECATGADVKIFEITNLPERYKNDLDLYITRFAILPRWKNNGNTPTKKLTVNIDWQGPKGDIPPEYEFRKRAVNFFIAPNSVELGEAIEIPTARAIVDYGVAPMGDEPMIFIWGRADYLDIFDKPHFIEWCYRLRFDRHDGKRLRATFIQWGEHNRTDED